ncbi:hypothetical protein AAC387_Pa04g1218 [Persea americana]
MFSNCSLLVGILGLVRLSPSKNKVNKILDVTGILKPSMGNANLTVICPISPDDRCRDETLCALRQRAKLILNKAVINEIAEDDVDDLSDQIRQLKVLIFSRARHRLGIFALENPFLSLLKPPQNPYCG